MQSRYALSVDVEDYFQVWAFSDVIERSSWDGFRLRVGEATRRCLDLFDEKNAKATFFTLGWVAERDPALIREIVDRGHELASHGFDHTKVFEQDRTAFLDDIVRTKTLLEDLGGAEVVGYRAAGFSIDARTPWAYDALAEAGYRYSSSSHPIAHDHYGDASGERNPHKAGGSVKIIEAPVATVDVAGRRMSCAGGGWFRALPFAASKRMIDMAAQQLDGPIIFYFHPWEIDPEQPRIKRASLKSKARHYLNLNAMHAKLALLLDTYSWTRIDDALMRSAA